MKRALACLLILLLAAVSQAAAPKNGGKKMEITSPAFKDHGFLPASPTNPPLTFANVPPGAKSLALLMEDIDATRGTFDHWLVFNLPPGTKGLAAGKLPVSARVGTNTGGQESYYPPSPPPGEVHRYVFTLYALDTVLPLKQAAEKAEIKRAMAGHELAKASLTGLFKR